MLNTEIFPGQPLATISASTCQGRIGSAETSANKSSQTATATSERIINGKGALNSPFLTRKKAAVKWFNFPAKLYSKKEIACKDHVTGNEKPLVESFHLPFITLFCFIFYK